MSSQAPLIQLLIMVFTVFNNWNLDEDKKEKHQRKKQAKIMAASSDRALSTPS